MERRELEFTGGSSSKFWNIELSGNTHTVHYGRIGTDGQRKTKEFDSSEKARASYEKLIAAKLKKGYGEPGRTAPDPAGEPRTATDKNDLADGETLEMQGSAAKPYVLRNVGGVYSCSCPAWRNQSRPIEQRTCKHLRLLRGDVAETERVGQLSGPNPTKSEGPGVLLAQTWDGELELGGWWLSEKLDGVRAYWDGEKMLSRLGNAFKTPDWFTDHLPYQGAPGWRAFRWAPAFPTPNANHRPPWEALLTSAIRSSLAMGSLGSPATWACAPNSDRFHPTVTFFKENLKVTLLLSWGFIDPSTIPSLL